MDVVANPRLHLAAISAALWCADARKLTWLGVWAGYGILRLLMNATARRCIKTLPRDVKGLKALIAIKYLSRKAFRTNLPVSHYFLECVRNYPDKEALVEVDTNRRFTYRELNALANRYANFFQARGFQKDDVVALYLENSADYIALWVGLSKLGVVTAWINSNLKLEPLGHSIKVSNCKAVVTSSSLGKVYKNAVEKGILPEDLKVYLLEEDKQEKLWESIESRLGDASESEPTVEKGPDFNSVLCYVYTSGTTGNPKPAVIRHSRFYFFATATHEGFDLQPKDRFYTTMPLYHAAAGIMAGGQMVLHGCTLVLRKKFSARNFWKDAIRFDASPESPEERQHRIRTIFGNGLRPALYDEFKRRFGIARVVEGYGSTEGNSNIVNIDCRPGACGFLPIAPFLRPILPLRLVKVDEETGEIVRGPDGLCVPCAPGETGEAVGQIKKDNPVSHFEGYLNKEDTEKKVLRDVLQKGDLFFTSGDILYWDELGYLYFKDRRGDTFRWKGENVSTMEVENILQLVMSVEDATVYGVEVPGHEGRAGMAAVVLKSGSDLESFLSEISSRLSDNLASYAIPVFLRICKEIDRTGTFKIGKAKLQKEGFDLEQCVGDRVFYWNVTQKRYVEMDKKMQEAIVSGSYNKI
ncbi:hypothetical protein QR680_016603 [Steinernema hermaphroditum]|uniref:long-chain-fatty-acid--CoA ligase n=1 Tax=Steinernema hermaphroditum TaxID=289476 RepID=A0AA39LML4_9BILA|nr:hypothetical protein QR680_016603 [Steinernema hermaphroditum]